MPRPRSPDSAGLPARWKLKHGAYYYRVPPAERDAWDGRTWFLLGHALPAAYAAYAARLEQIGKVQTVGALLDRYALEVVPTKAPATQESNAFAIKQLRPAFGAAKLTAVRPLHIYQYVDKRTKKVAAHREIEVLSHAFTKAVEWGLLDRHPFKGEVRLEGEKPRERLVEAWELDEAMTAAPRMLRAFVALKLLTGMRQGDLLRLRAADCQVDGVHVKTHKTGKPVIYEWSDALRLAVDEAKAARPVDISPWLFCTRKGACYVNARDKSPGFKSLWQRFMARVLKSTKVREPFTEHDLRAFVASNAESLERARALLAHTDARTTQRVYRRKPERVRPTS